MLAEALPYIQKYTGKTIVVKYGGNAMISDELRRAVMSDIILLNLVGIRVVAEDLLSEVLVKIQAPALGADLDVPSGAGEVDAHLIRVKVLSY